MTNDIVTRLREIADADVYRADISVSKLYEAADEIERLGELLFQEIYYGQEKLDEIERLRGELADWKRTVRALEEQIMQNG